MSVGAVVSASAKEPYVGLRAFRRDESDKFFGREREAHDLGNLWQANRLTILYSASGLGKTSLIQAGVLPLIRTYNTDVLPIGRVSFSSTFPTPALPEHNPHVFALLSSWAPQESPIRLAGLTLRSFFERRQPRFDPYGDPVSVLVAIDQMEELFIESGHRRPYREWFISQLVDALKVDPNLHLLMSIREDRLNDLLFHEFKLAGIDKVHFDLTPLYRPEAIQAVEGPLVLSTRSFVAGVSDALVDDLCRAEVDGRTIDRDFVEPFRLQVACETLWRSLPKDSVAITSDHVRRFAHIDGSLTDFGDSAIAQVAVDHSYAGGASALKRWLAANFIDGSGNRRHVYQGQTQTAGVPNTLVRSLINHNILRTEWAMGEHWCVLSHDRLVDWLVTEDTAPTESTEESPETHLLRAHRALIEGNFTMAHEEARRAAGFTSDLQLLGEIESFLGNVAYTENDFGDAYAHYERAAELFTQTGETNEAVGRLLAALGKMRLYEGRPDLAISELTSALTRVGGDDPSVMTQLCWAFWYAGDPAAAKDLLDGLLLRQGNLPEALRARGQVFVDLNRPEDGLRDLDMLGVSQHPSAYAARALALERLGRSEEADLAIAEAVTAGPDEATVLMYKALILWGRGRRAPAADLVRQAMAAPPPPLPAHLLRLAWEILGPDR
ncbi:tetratricopeptide repeat protein [Herbidospora mongoliensis]|uniref:tetratricopeptide repeat protein n=1 Tax=Herbidospora mongoliensis TaxID=688067 RepID=UPI00083760A4|nr:tetratricopeptide repeat protein [Herbidospora mongoliensis]